MLILSSKNVHAYTCCVVCMLCCIFKAKYRSYLINTKNSFVVGRFFIYKMYVNVLDKHRNLKEEVYCRINTFLSMEDLILLLMKSMVILPL